MNTYYLLREDVSQAFADLAVVMEHAAVFGVSMMSVAPCPGGLVIEFDKEFPANQLEHLGMTV